MRVDFPLITNLIFPSNGIPVCTSSVGIKLKASSTSNNMLFQEILVLQGNSTLRDEVNKPENEYEEKGRGKMDDLHHLILCGHHSD